MKRCLLLLLGACTSPVPGNSADAAVVLEPDAKPCEGDCKTTALTATFMATRTLDVAYYGSNSDLTLYIEAYAGAAAGCPTMNSPSPDYTLILGRVTADGSPANFFDFKGDMLPSAAPATATAVALQTVTFGPTFVAYDASVTFDAGTINGHFYATHCDSLDR